MGKIVVADVGSASMTLHGSQSDRAVGLGLCLGGRGFAACPLLVTSSVVAGVSQRVPYRGVINEELLLLIEGSVVIVLVDAVSSQQTLVLLVMAVTSSSSTYCGCLE